MIPKQPNRQQQTDQLADIQHDPHRQRRRLRRQLIHPANAQVLREAVEEEEEQLDGDEGEEVMDWVESGIRRAEDGAGRRGGRQGEDL